MVKIEIAKRVDPAEWRTLISSLNGNPFHLPEIFPSNSAADDIVYVVFRKDGQVVGAAAGLCIEKKYLKLLTVSRTLYLPTTPAVMAGCGPTSADLLVELKNFLGPAGYKALEVEPRWGEDFSNSPLSAYVDRRLLEFTVDLEKEEEELLKAMHQKHRKNIRKSQEAGLILDKCSSADEFLRLRDMQQSSSERAAERGNRYNVMDKDSYADTYGRIYSNGPGEVIFARSGDDYVAGLAYLAFGRNAITVRSGSTPEGYETSAMYFLQYELIKDMKRRGFKELNIGGVPAEALEPSHQQHGLYNYKKYYGGKPCLRTGLKITLRKG